MPSSCSTDCVLKRPPLNNLIALISSESAINSDREKASDTYPQVEKFCEILTQLCFELMISFIY